MKKATTKINVAGLPITPFSQIDEAVDSICSADKIKPGFAVAINAEKVVTSLEKPKIYELLKQADLLFADGVPIVWAIKRHGVDSARIPGCELWESLMRKAGKLDLKVFILGASESVNLETSEKLKDKFNVRNLVRHSGYYKDESVIHQIVEVEKPDIVTVAMGSPKQEELIIRLRKTYPDAFYMGVGGTYDVFTGQVKRAPKVFQKLNAEWLYRLLKQPFRFKRQLNLLKFMYLYVARSI